MVVGTDSWKMTLAVFVLTCLITSTLSLKHSFTVDYNNATFLQDGKPFRYISGSLHYSRVHPYYWKDRLTKMRISGLNTVQTYVPWNIHEPMPGDYQWTGLADLETFLKTAQEVGLNVLLRSGPYICGEWEFGGFPAWLLTKNPDMVLRTSDPSYIAEVDKWYSVLLPKIKPFLYENGGPVIMVQIENEYGSYFACDYDYVRFLYNKVRSVLGNTVVIYTTDGDGDSYIKCGAIAGAYATIDFGVTYTPAKNFAVQRHYEPNGPAVNSEFYTGWLDHWGSPHSTTDMRTVAKSLDLLLDYGANINMYMFEGGTNFAYWNGANAPPYQPVPTSYDYDSPLNETGDITDKYIAIRQIISKYNPLPAEPIPPNTPKCPYGTVQMDFMTTIQGSLETTSPGGPVKSRFPLTMEQIKFYYGFILYRHVLKSSWTLPTALVTNGTRDRGYVMVNEVPMGILNRDLVWQVNITGEAGQYLDILVENQARIGFSTLMNYNQKGLTSNITLNGNVLEDWEIYPITLENIRSPSNFTRQFRAGPKKSASGDLETPSIYMGKIPVPNMAGMPQDSFLDMRPWHKGQALVNGFNLGRYWPVAGPQVTLYVPKPELVAPPGTNTLVMLELESTECQSRSSCTIQFVDTPFINETPKGSTLSLRVVGENFDWHKFH
ncbi:beta-galactosidase-like [Haliotis rufescens]|uniref:beta-galactosidase-like n=1 Tax=Haliotis rufescens TaxID=6454 RepID=UPI001EB046F8|nr:beta-galactosidase-like [Haliotis rufescens]